MGTKYDSGNIPENNRGPTTDRISSQEPKPIYLIEGNSAYHNKRVFFIEKCALCTPGEIHCRGM